MLCRCWRNFCYHWCICKWDIFWKALCHVGLVRLRALRQPAWTSVTFAAAVCSYVCEIWRESQGEIQKMTWSSVLGPANISHLTTKGRGHWMLHLPRLPPLNIRSPCITSFVIHLWFYPHNPCMNEVRYTIHETSEWFSIFYSAYALKESPNTFCGPYSNTDASWFQRKLELGLKCHLFSKSAAYHFGTLEVKVHNVEYILNKKKSNKLKQ